MQAKYDKNPFPKPGPEGVLSRSITGGKWLTIGYILQRTIGLVSFVVLARMLDPKDFGIMALVLLIPKFLQSTTETGLTAAVTQRGGDVRPFLNPIWTIGVIKSAAIMILTFIVGPFIAPFLNVPDAVTAIRLGGVFIFIQNLANIGELFFFKDLDFKKIFLRDTAKELAYVIAAVISVFFVRSYWTLMIATGTAYLIQMLSTYLLHPYRPSLSINWMPLKTLFGYSKWIVGQGWLTQLFGTLEQGMVARLTDITQTGLYTKAKSVASVAPGFLSTVVTKVSFPAYAKIKHEQEKITSGLMKSLHIFAFFIFPVGFLIIVAGGELILIALGQQWLPMFNTMRFLFIYFSLNLLIDFSYTVFNAVGLPKEKFLFETIRLTVTISLLFVLTIFYGIEGAAFALVFGTVMTGVFVIRHLIRLTYLRLADILRAVSVPLAASVLITIPLLVFKSVILSSTALFVLITFLSVICYFGLIYAAQKFWNQGPYVTLAMVGKYFIRL